MGPCRGSAETTGEQKTPLAALVPAYLPSAHSEGSRHPGDWYRWSQLSGLEEVLQRGRESFT